MIAFLLTLLMVQGIPVLPGESGTVSGVVRTSAGGPAAGVRVSAMVPPDPAADVATSGSFASLGQTDELGRYRLEGIPAGRYYIVAGRVDLPTYYPGTADISTARIFSVAPGGAVSGIDFVMMDTSIRSAQDVLGIRLPTLSTITIPVRVILEGGAKLSTFAAGGFTAVRFIDTTGAPQRSQLVRDSFPYILSAPTPIPAYRVIVENLPEGYIVMSMKYGANDVMSNTLKIPPVLLPRSVISIVNGVTQTAVVSAPPPGQSASELTITLATVPVAPLPGVRVTGRTKDTEVRPIYLSGTPGTLYSDGTFEFRGVPSGRHNIAALGTSMVNSLGASIVVGDRDVEGVELETMSVLPLDVQNPKPPDAAGNHAPGSVIRLASFRGRLTEEASGKPIEEGTVKLIGRESAVVPVGTEGQFEISRLLPGTYDLEVRIFGHSNVLRTIVIGDEDIRLEVTTLRLY